MLTIPTTKTALIMVGVGRSFVRYMGTSVMFMVVKVSWVCSYPKIHQVVYIKYAQIFYMSIMLQIK